MKFCSCLDQCWAEGHGLHSVIEGLFLNDEGNMCCLTPYMDLSNLAAL
jgi:hypothetical protein